MLAAKNLERLLEIEAELKEQYEDKLKAKDEEIAAAVAKQDDLQAVIEKQKNSLKKQQEEIVTLSDADNDTKRIEQLNRELTSRASKLQEELEAQKKKNKSIQKETQSDREQLKELKQYDVKKMKKNLDQNKKKVAELNASNSSLQKNYNKFKNENIELKDKVKDLEAKIEAVEAKEEKLKDGLAMSSRNARLTTQQRAEAPLIFQTLTKTNQLMNTIAVDEIDVFVKEEFSNSKLLELEYFTIAEEESLERVTLFEPNKKYRAFIAVNAGNVRLIDNISLSVNN